MKLQQITIDDIAKLHLVFRAYRSHDGFASLFRGQANINWPLLPKAGRPDYFLPHNRDIGRFNAWRGQAIAYSALPENEIEQLAFAQHHGLATRLLDWSMNPLVACYFACAEEAAEDGAVFIFETPHEMATEQTTIENLENIEGVVAYMPRSISPRVLNQKGVFTVHCQANRGIDIQSSRIDETKPNLLRVVIPSRKKAETLKLLADYGIDRSVLFPDLDGLSSHINTGTVAISANV